MPRFFDKFKDLKDNFIKEVTDKQNSQYLFTNALESCYDTEFEFNKDVSEFTYEELDILWGNMRARSIDTLLSRKSVLNMYTEYAIDKGYNKTKINFVEMYKPEDMKKYVDQNWKENKVIDRETLYTFIIDKCTNAQDSAIFILLFEGAWGEGLEELRLLRLKDVDDKDNILTLRHTSKDTGEIVERTLDVSEKCIDILLKAGNEIEYKNSNGNPDSNAKHKEFDLAETEYVLKNTIRGNSLETNLVSAYTITQRLSKMKKILEYRYLNPSNVRLSGIVDFTKDYLKLSGKNADQLNTKDYEIILKRFGENVFKEDMAVKKHSLKRKIYDYIKN